MFENIFKGFSFIKESFSLITKDADLIRPSIYSIFVGVFFTIISGIVLFLLRSLIPAELFYILAFLVLLVESTATKYVSSRSLSGYTQETLTVMNTLQW